MCDMEDYDEYFSGQNIMQYLVSLLVTVLAYQASRGEGLRDRDQKCNKKWKG